ncbi:isoprenoid biosynthesis glyoxalase ElbB [Shewanella youngdeokensis]|uniref:Glyoxalase n=1 Tax=Shewanella youngdeokensis TaxID=2999068 RepID=A0ABZ0K0P9_9GAMM|nr:isoprenoid biosynthesis glyoxalase ElbB [Shewanella sp. DAU334]
MKKVAVLLSGCGVFDGAEIHESVLTLLELARSGASYQCFAPDIAQLHVVNHLTGDIDEADQRNVLVESARVARGEVKPLTDMKIDEFDALVVPGGFGAAKNLCNFAVAGAELIIDSGVKRFITQFTQVGKPVGFMCIAPVMIPQCYEAGVLGTIGSDPHTAAAFELQGGQHQITKVDDIVVDEVNKVVSTPAYMLADNIVEVHNGITKLVASVLNMA